MTYIDRLNVFNRWLESNALPGNAQLMYFRLLNVFNGAGWPESVQMDTLRLMQLTGCQKAAAYTARDKLVEAGFIGYKKGSKGRPSRYFLCDKKTENHTENRTENPTKTRTENATHRERYKNKTENKTKNTRAQGPRERQSSYDIEELEELSHLLLPKEMRGPWTDS